MNEAYISNITLKNYRNFSHLELKIESKIVLLTGPNGSGKTNVLEAISLLSSGRGLKTAKFDEICRFDSNFWQSDIQINNTDVGLIDITNSYNLKENKRLIEFNGVKASNLDLNKFINIVWLTPQMSGLFLSTSSIRRKFLDRIVYSFDPSHAKRINKYEYYLLERNKILQGSFYDQSWLNIVEDKLASAAYEVTKKRHEILDLLNNSIRSMPGSFPKTTLLITQDNAHMVEPGDLSIDMIKNFLFESRKRDQAMGRTSYGPHRIDLVATHYTKHLQAKFCSTGEQKAMLTTIILSQISAMLSNNKRPILLLDETFVHLDQLSRENLMHFITKADLQIWLSDVSTAKLQAISKSAQIIKFS